MTSELKTEHVINISLSWCVLLRDIEEALWAVSSTLQGRHVHQKQGRGWLMTMFQAYLLEWSKTFFTLYFGFSHLSPSYLQIYSSNLNSYAIDTWRSPLMDWHAPLSNAVTRADSYIASCWVAIATEDQTRLDLFYHCQVTDAASENLCDSESHKVDAILPERNAQWHSCRLQNFILCSDAWFEGQK